ncbi:MAG: hypothetical protein ACXVAR_19115 [Vulcanimicrobiaceae bacterium]
MSRFGESMVNKVILRRVAETFVSEVGKRLIAELSAVTADDAECKRRSNNPSLKRPDLPVAPERKKPPAKPKLDPFIVVIDGILGDM